MNYKRVKLTCIPELTVEYEIDTNGVIYGKGRHGDKFEPMHPSDNGRGYLRIHLGKKKGKGFRINTYIHRLVAKQFIPNPENKPQVNHKDGNKKNNNVDNLEWVTKQENEDHKKFVLGNINGYEIFCKNRETGKVYKFMSILDCAKFTGVTDRGIRWALDSIGYSSGWWFSLTGVFPKDLSIPKGHRKKIYARSVKTGECFEFKTYADAVRFAGGPGQIFEVLKGRRQVSHGYYWSYKPFK